MRCNKLVYLSVYPIPCMRELLKRYEDKSPEIFAPCTASRFITKYQISGMMNTGLEVIYCNANVSFEDTEIFFWSHYGAHIRNSESHTRCYIQWWNGKGTYLFYEKQRANDRRCHF